MSLIRKIVNSVPRQRPHASLFSKVVRITGSVGMIATVANTIGCIGSQSHTRGVIRRTTTLNAPQDLAPRYRESLELLRNPRSLSAAQVESLHDLFFYGEGNSNKRFVKHGFLQSLATLNPQSARAILAQSVAGFTARLQALSTSEWSDFAKYDQERAADYENSAAILCALEVWAHHLAREEKLSPQEAQDIFDLVRLSQESLKLFSKATQGQILGLEERVTVEEGYYEEGPTDFSDWIPPTFISDAISERMIIVSRRILETRKKVEEDLAEGRPDKARLALIRAEDELRELRKAQGVLGIDPNFFAAALGAMDVVRAQNALPR